MNVRDIGHELLAFVLLPIWLVMYALECFGLTKHSMWPEVDDFYRSWRYP